MKLNKANLAGLTSPGQQSEMKSILAGTWPPLKPLPVFKYETAEYRATIDFDKKRGEWVCRKTSLPSNEVQELRGGLRAITMALPHGEAEMFGESADPQEQELEKDANRRLQAIREWREKYENGAHYFELREFLSEGQRTELDDSLRLTLTARQLQFSARNVADVFDDVSVAGGRFATLIEFATRSKANGGTDPQAPEEGALLEAEPEVVNDKQTLEVSSRELEPVLSNVTNPVANNADPPVQDQEAAERDADADDFPAVSIKNVFPEREQPSMAERMTHTASQQFEIENSEIVEEDPALPVEPPREEGNRSPAFAVFAAQVRAGQSFAEPIGSSSWRFPALKISAFHVNVFAILFLFAATAFTVGLTVGRGPVAKRLREPPQSLLVTDAKPPALPDAMPDASDESIPRTPPPAVVSSDDLAGLSRPADAAPSAEKSIESPPSAGPAEARSPNADSSPAVEPKPTAKPELPAQHSSEIAPMVRSMRPPPRSKILRRPKAVRSTRTARRIPSPYGLTSTMAATPHPIGAEPPLPRASTILVNVPDRESQPFRVSFPNKTIAATSSLAMTSQLSVLVSPEPGTTGAYKPARLEAGELGSFVWPHFLGPRGRYGLAETIRVRASIGQLGQVLDVRFLGGSASLLPATVEAVRQWRYRPTLMDKRPVQAQQDITIEFRPPQYSARLSTQHPSHN